MKLVLFNDYRLGVENGDAVVDVTDALPGKIEVPARQEARAGQIRMEQAIVGFDALRADFVRLQSEGRSTPLSQVQLRAPLPAPSKIICMGVTCLEFTDAPGLPMIMFLKHTDAILDPGATLTIPSNDTYSICHHEAEFTAVIGKAGRNIPAAEAMDHVFGYTNSVDVSCRGEYGGNSFMGKNFDGFCPLGPNITTKDEIPDPANCQIRFWVDGQARHDYNTSDWAHGLAKSLEYVSSFVTLRPGDFVTMGTNHQGIGPLQDGETAEMETEGVGRLVFHIKGPEGRSWPKEIDTRMAETVLNRVLTSKK